MRTLLFAFVSCAVVMAIQAQSLQKPFRFITSDRMGYTYAAYPRGVYKIDSNSTEVLRVYEDFENGTISSVDVTNPLKVLLFFSDLQRLVVLDRNLTFITRYDLLQLGFTNITAACQSADGRFWLFDATDFKLKKMDENGRLLRESQPLQLLTGDAVIALFMLEQNGNVYLADSTSGIIEFDLFASYKRKTPLRGVARFEIMNGQFMFTRDSRLVQYDPLLLVEKPVYISPHGPVQQILIHGRYAVELQAGRLLMNRLQ